MRLTICGENWKAMYGWRGKENQIANVRFITILLPPDILNMMCETKYEGNSIKS